MTIFDQIESATGTGAIIPKILLYGPTGSGRSLSSLKLAKGLAGDKKILCLSYDRKGRAEQYGVFIQYDYVTLTDKSPESLHNILIELSQDKKQRYGVIICDGFSETWHCVVDRQQNLPNGKLKEKTNMDDWQKSSRPLNQLVNFVSEFNLPLILTCSQRDQEEEFIQTKQLGEKVDLIFRLGEESYHLQKSLDRFAFLSQSGKFLTEEIGKTIFKSCGPFSEYSAIPVKNLQAVMDITEPPNIMKRAVSFFDGGL